MPVDVGGAVVTVAGAPPSFEAATGADEPAGFVDEGCAVAIVARQTRKPKEDSAATA